MPILFDSGKACQRQDDKPAIMGVANEVPLLVVGCPVLAFATTEFTPNAATEGFICPSLLGP